MSVTPDIPFDVDAVVNWCLDNPELLDDNLSTALSRVGRNYEPQLLATLHAEIMLTREQLAKHVGSAWSASEYPDKLLDHAEWEDLFDGAGYTVDGVPAERPTESLMLYRGSVPERSTDWSWTDNIEVARKYAGGHFRRPVGKVYVADVPPSALLARNTGRSEDEYVVNTRGLTITVAE